MIEGSTLGYELVADPSEAHLDSWESQWKAFVDDLGIGRGSTSSWRWPKKATFVSERAGWKVISVVSDNRSHGLVLLSWPEGSRLGKDEQVLYVEYLEVAPWNRKDLVKGYPEFKNVGKLLIYVAVTESLEAGFAGRVNLHALGSAEGFYERIGMRRCEIEDCGPDGSLCVFEFDEIAADAFIHSMR